MKFVSPLNEVERMTLQEASKEGPTARVRQRAQAVYLSAKGFTIPQLVEITEMDRDTVSGWITAWEQRGVMGLYDAPRCGRPPILSAADREWLRECVSQEPRQLRQAQARLAESRGKQASHRTLTRALKKKTSSGNGYGAR